MTAVDEAGRHASAAKKLGVSYRYALELVRGGSRIFGAPLVAMTRGRGAMLTPLGKATLGQQARLDPSLDSLASELEVEIERVVSDVKPTIRIHASHGFAIGILRDFLLSMGTTITIDGAFPDLPGKVRETRSA